jgi:hypothetical protein
MGWRREVLKEGNFQKPSGLLQESGNSGKTRLRRIMMQTATKAHMNTVGITRNHTAIEHRLERRDRCILSLRV